MTFQLRPFLAQVEAEQSFQHAPAPPAKEAPARRSVFAPKPRDDLSQCPNCGRNFAHDRIEKHEQICRKTSNKKRKTFDMTKKRTQGTDAEVYVKRASRSKGQKEKVSTVRGIITLPCRDLTPYGTAVTVVG